MTIKSIHQGGVITLLLILGFSALLLSQQAEAVPTFARQTGMACVSCHSQNFPALNSFGRVFRTQGYTMRGAAPLIEGNDLSIPADLKASLITKLRYQLDGSVDGSRGEVQWPDEAALLIGGRAAEDIGFLLEAGLGPQEGHATVDTAGPVAAGDEIPVETGGNFLSYKVHVNATPNLAAVVFGTDGLGVGYGMELMNTGLQRSQRPIENRSGFSAAQRLGTASGTATGVALVYHTPNLMVNYSHWAPTWGNVNANIVGGLASYLRVNYFINASGWDMGLGASYMGGTVEHGANDPASKAKVDGMGIDMQALGELGGMPVEFYLSYGLAGASDASCTAGGAGTDGACNTYNEGTDNHTALGLLGKVGFNSQTSAYLAYGTDDDGTDTVSDVTLGVQYMLAQNAKLELYNVSNSGGAKSDDYTMLMLFSGF